MQNVMGIVAEFNPFHNGHKQLLAYAHAQGAQGIVAVMSGNFVQRGSPAITDKRVRTQAALACGVDLVLELPLVFAAAPAHRFARGAVEILAATGCIDTLAFGSEIGQIQPLVRAAEAVDSHEFSQVLGMHLAEGVTFAKARQAAVAACAGEEISRLLASPNNALAIEYLRAAKLAKWDMQGITLARKGVAHDSAAPNAQYASASFLRAHAHDQSLLAAYVPQETYPVYDQAHQTGIYPAHQAAIETAMLMHLRRLNIEALANLPDLSEGLENRLYAAIRSACTMTELLFAVKTKRYTMARVRRLILAAFLGITDTDSRYSVPYIRVLGCTPRGSQILSTMKQTARLPVSHSLARLRALGGVHARFAQLEEMATDLYAFTLPRPLPCGYEYTARPIFLKDAEQDLSFS